MRRRSTYVSVMERDYQESTTLMRGLLWAGAVSLPFWAVTLGALLVMVGTL